LVRGDRVHLEGMREVGRGNEGGGGGFRGRVG
jgi:hypothetical protein